MEAEDSPKTGEVMKITLLGSRAVDCPCLCVLLPEWQRPISFGMVGWKTWGLIVASNKLNVITLVVECILYALRQTPAKAWADLLKKKATSGTGFNYTRQQVFKGHERSQDSTLGPVLQPFCRTHQLREPHSCWHPVQAPWASCGVQGDHRAPCTAFVTEDAAAPALQHPALPALPLSPRMLQHPALPPPPWGTAAGREGRCTGQDCTPCNCSGIPGDSPTLN